MPGCDNILRKATGIIQPHAHTHQLVILTIQWYVHNISDEKIREVKVMKGRQTFIACKQPNFCLNTTVEA